MSRRYGRQQKRKARNQIAALQKELALTQAKFDKLSQRSRRDRETVELTAEILGRYFISLPPLEQQELDISRLDSSIRIPYDRFTTRYYLQDHHEAHQAEQVILYLNCLRYSGTHRDELGRAMHVRFKLNGNPIGYGFTDEAFKYAPKEYVVERISKEMAIALIERMPYSGD